MSDEAFPSENDESIPSCLPPFPVPPGTNKTKGVPDDRNDTGEAPKAPVNFPGDLERFSLFMRFLAPPTPVAPTFFHEPTVWCSSRTSAAICATPFRLPLRLLRLRP